MENIKIGVVGCGYWGPNHIRNFDELPEANITTICDLDEKRLQKIKIKYPNLETTTDFKAFLQNNINAVVVATPVKTHYQLAKEALLHDKHVLIEKPITTEAFESSLLRLFKGSI